MVVWIALILVPTFIVLYWLRNYGDAKKPTVYAKYGTKFNGLVKALPCLNKVFHPTWWCPFGFTQTVARQLFRSRPSLPWRREVIDLPDGGITATDWLEPEDSNDQTPIVFFLPGITGSTHNCAYIIHCAIDVQKQGWRSIVVNPRGLGGVPLKTAKTYNAAMTDDFQHIVALVNKRYPESKKIACGFSMGGMILWNYLAKSTPENAGLNAAIIVSSPFDTFKSTASLETFWPKLFFNGHLAQCLKDIVIPYKHLFEDKLDWDKLMKTDTIRGFDANFVVPMFGYRDWEHYYTDAALSPKVHKIPVPMLALNSSDDCFAPIDSIPFDEILKSANIASVVTRHGGHTSFMTKANPSASGLVEELLVEYMKMVIENY